MSGAKREMERLEDCRREAVSVLIAAKVIRTCEYHGDTLLDGPGDIQDAYRIANARFSRGDYKGLFASRREMTDFIQAASKDTAMSCGRCDKLLAD